MATDKELQDQARSLIPLAIDWLRDFLSGKAAIEVDKSSGNPVRSTTTIRLKRDPA